jgi:RNA polymerase sigma factor (sigma-70 family)
VTHIARSQILGYLRSLSAKDQLNGVPDSELLARFTSQHDEAAFAVLVRRHGAMVQQVCRSLLHNGADADDAFQAAFIVLARKASAIRKKGSLGSWLYGVAHRTSLKARAARATRKRHEACVRPELQGDVANELSWHEAQCILHEELGKLPEKYRAPLVLCYLEGKRQDEAERHLGWPRGKLRSMLERAREALRKRLLRRGLGASAVLLAAASLGSASAVPAAAVLASLTRVAVAISTGAPTAAAVSAHVSSLAESVLRAINVTKIKFVCCGLLVIGAFAFVMSQRTDHPSQTEPTTAAAVVFTPNRNARLSLAHFEPMPTRSITVSLRASDCWDEHTPHRAFDGQRQTRWNAYYAPQWIEADLRNSLELCSIVLITAQLPAGYTTHEIWVSDEAIGEDRTKAKLVHTFAGHTTDNQQLKFDFPKDLFARYFQVHTTASPSWVGWGEIELRVRREGGEYVCRSDANAPTQLQRTEREIARLARTDAFLPAPPGVAGPQNPVGKVTVPEPPFDSPAKDALVPGSQTPVWEPAPPKLRFDSSTKDTPAPSLAPPAKQSFAKGRSQTEFGNEIMRLSTERKQQLPDPIPIPSLPKE